MSASFLDLPTAKAPRLPAFASVLKSRAVEDPINLWINRPLAYSLVALIYRTGLTPNHITALSVLMGGLAAACIFAGTPSSMLWGGALLWFSAILDGADGILARARQSTSELGRALDGTADLAVALWTVLAAVYHLWMQTTDPRLWIVAPLAVGSAAVHIYLYDFYKESFLQMTNPQWNGKPERIAEVEARLQKFKAAKAGVVAIVASRLYVDLVRAQTKLVALTNPWGRREHLSFKVNDASARLYRRHHHGPMQLWALISLAPHTYLMATCAMFDRLDLYLWLRLFAANVLFVGVLLWQRSASRRTRAELETLGLTPLPI